MRPWGESYNEQLLRISSIYMSHICAYVHDLDRTRDMGQRFYFRAQAWYRDGIKRAKGPTYTCQSGGLMTHEILFRDQINVS